MPLAAYSQTALPIFVAPSSRYPSTLAGSVSAKISGQWADAGRLHQKLITGLVLVSECRTDRQDSTCRPAESSPLPFRARRKDIQGYK